LARAQVGIALAAAVMYLRILAMIAVFNWSLAASLACLRYRFWGSRLNDAVRQMRTFRDD